MVSLVRFSRTAAPALAVLMLMLTGCGAVAGRGDAASAVAVGLLNAVAAGDGPAACAVLAPETLVELVQSAGEPCAEAILDEGLPAAGRVTGTDVYGQWARVVLTGDTVFLAVFPGGWRVVAAGCAPRGERPYDCTLQKG
jgi:hypothetical protein